MSDMNHKKGPGPEKRYIRRKSPLLDALKALLLIVVILAAGWGISVRGERLKKAETLADIVDAGVTRTEELKDLKWMIEKGELTEAIVSLKEITRGNEENFVAHYLLGVAFAKKGLMEEALAAFERVIELGGWEDKAYYNIGIIYESLGFFDRAYGAYEAARTADPQNNSYIRARDKVDYVIEADLGFETQYQLRFNEAAVALVTVPPDLEFSANTFEHLAARFPHMVEPLHMLGVVRARQGRLEEAEKIFLQAVEMEPGFALSHYNLGVTYQVRGMWRKAYDSFVKCLRLTDDDKNAKVVSTHIEQVKQYITELNP